MIPNAVALQRTRCEFFEVRAMSEIKHSFVRTNGINMHVAETGEGFPVVFCHGFPEMWYSWRHQMEALAEARFRAIAPDQRGYGETEAPAPIEAYTQRKLVGDIVGMLDALGIGKCVLVGQADRCDARDGGRRLPLHSLFSNSGRGGGGTRTRRRPLAARLLPGPAGNRSDGDSQVSTGCVRAGRWRTARSILGSPAWKISHRRGLRRLRARIQEERLSRRPELVSMHRPELGGKRRSDRSHRAARADDHRRARRRASSRDGR